MTEQLNQQLNEVLTEALGLKEHPKTHQDALLKFEYVHRIKKQMFPDSHNELRFIQTQIATLCNILSMRFLQSQNFITSLNLLKKAEMMTPDNDRLRAATYNNFACLYRRTKKLRIALNYLEKALEIEYLHLNLSDDYQYSLLISNPADIHLNICAILSQMDKHELALQHSMRALTMIQQELLILSRQATQRESSLEQVRQNKQDRFVVITIAYHNIGVEHEFLKQFQYAVQSYSKAVQFASQFLGESHPMTGNLKQVVSQATKQIANSIQKTLARKQAKSQSIQALASGQGGRMSPPPNQSYGPSERTGGDIQLLLKQTHHDMQFNQEAQIQFRLPNLKKKQHYSIKGMKNKPLGKTRNKRTQNYEQMIAHRGGEVIF